MQQQWPKLLAHRPIVAEHPNPDADGSKGRSFAAVLSDSRLSADATLENVWRIVMAAHADPEKSKRVKAKNLQCFHLLGDDVGWSGARCKVGLGVLQRRCVLLGS